MLLCIRQLRGAGRTIPTNTSTRQLRAFSGDPELGASAPVRGNPCLLHIADTAPTAPPSPSPLTQCVTWAGQARRGNVRCWTPSGKEIELCGHGLLCCASYWGDQPDGPDVLEMNGMEVQCQREGNMHWLAFPTVKTQLCAVPAWAPVLLGQAPAMAAEAGPENAYLVLEMPADIDIASLTAPGEALEAHSGRSLIVTRRVSAETSRMGENVQYRYFAPQHGVPEDTATGSAMRVVAAYWQQQGAGEELKALQRSADGGWLQSRIDNHLTWIGGRVVIDREAA